METRRQLALQRKAEEEKTRAAEQERKQKEDADRRKREREENTDKRPLKGLKKVSCFSSRRLDTNERRSLRTTLQRSGKLPWSLRRSKKSRNLHQKTASHRAISRLARATYRAPQAKREAHTNTLRNSLRSPLLPHLYRSPPRSQRRRLAILNPRPRKAKARQQTWTTCNQRSFFSRKWPTAQTRKSMPPRPASPRLSLARA